MLTFGGRRTSTQVLLSMRALYSSHIACFQLGSQRAWKGDLGIGDEVVTCKLYLGLAFTILNLERVTIGCCEVGGGGGGGVVGGVGVVCGDGVDRGVGGVDCGVVCGFVCRVVCEVKAPISAMIVRVPEKDRWCGTRGKFVRWKGVRVTKASKRAKMGVRDELFGFFHEENALSKIGGEFLYMHEMDRLAEAEFTAYKVDDFDSVNIATIALALASMKHAAP
ncbi:hypothetical protein Tco_0378138 [Tanacetum coccineum]